MDEIMDVYNLGKDLNGLVNTVDFESLIPAQQEKLRVFKIALRIENEKYLRAHPEVEEIITDFLSNVLIERPTDVREFAAIYFNNAAEVAAQKKKKFGESDEE